MRNLRNRMKNRKTKSDFRRKRAHTNKRAATQKRRREWDSLQSLVAVSGCWCWWSTLRLLDGKKKSTKGAFIHTCCNDTENSPEAKADFFSVEEKIHLIQNTAGSSETHRRSSDAKPAKVRRHYRHRQSKIGHRYTITASGLINQERESAAVVIYGGRR